MGIHDERAASLLLKAAAHYIAREAGRGTLITPTRAEIAPDRKNATIFVSVFPREDLPNALTFLIRHRDLFRNYLKKEARFATLPFIRFEEDAGEQHRQHIEDISRGI
jgi:ribosome-binding factor A